MDDKKQTLVYQDNKLSSARVDYTVVERRLYFLCLSKVLPQLPGAGNGQMAFEPIVIKRQELAEWFGNDNVDDYISKRALDTMFRRVMVLNTEDEYMLQHIFDNLRYSKKYKELRVLFSASMKPFLLELQNGGYTKLVLEQFFELQSTYSQSLYMLCMEYRNIGKRTLTIDELRFSLGVPDTAYPQMKDFTRRVINRAIDEINAKTLYVVAYEKHKVGRNVESITFVWREKAFLPDGTQADKPKPSPAAQKRLEKAHSRRIAELNNAYYEAKDKGEENEFIASLPLNLQAKIKERLAGK